MLKRDQGQTENLIWGRTSSLPYLLQLPGANRNVPYGMCQLVVRRPDPLLSVVQGRAALTIARMPALMASGSAFQAATTAVRSGRVEAA